MTTITESFNKADSTTLGPDLTWSEPQGSFDVASNRAVHQSGAPASARAEADLASADHYAEASLFSTPNTTARAGVCVRFSSSATTYYAFWARRSGSITYRLLKCVAGTQTTLLDVNTTAVTLPATLRLEVSGSTLTGYVNGVQVIQTTDSSITTGTRTGIFGEGTAGNLLDAFAAGDLSAPIPTGSGSGSWTFTGAASGATTDSGTGTGSWAFSGAAAGTSTHQGAGAGSWAFAGTAAGAADPAGDGSGSWSFTGSADGTAPTVGETSGSGSGSWAFSGTAAGTQAPSGAASGAWAYAGSAAGTATNAGTGSGTWAYTGTAAGTGHGPSDFRDITLTATGPVQTTTWAGAGPVGSSHQATGPVGNTLTATGPRS